jgi:hypothetical protein
MPAFSDYVQKQIASSVELPMVHTTEYFRLASIKTGSILQLTACDVFNEPLLYFFYGRPAYRDASQTHPVRDIGFYPICFVFRPGTICKKVKRLYPFDTGAAHAGLYEPEIARANALADYSVVTAIENARKIVSGFFETEEQYLSNKPKSGLHFSSSESDAQSYYELITGGGDADCDDRRSAVEIQIADSLDLRQGIMAIVLPTCFLEDKDLQNGTQSH